MTVDAHALLARLQDATNARDLEAVVGCFTAAYRNETPAHPARGFVGAAQVRTNWQQIFTFVPDLTARVLAKAVNGDVVWSEWEMSGTRLDGTPHHLRGVIIFGLEQGQAAWARFYLEPVDQSAMNVDDAVRVQVHADTTP